MQGTSKDCRNFRPAHDAVQWKDVNKDNISTADRREGEGSMTVVEFCNDRSYSLLEQELKLSREGDPSSMNSSQISLLNQNDDFTLVFSDTSMRGSLLYRLNTFRQHREFCDVVLFVQEKEIVAHKVVLAACSPVLFDMFVRDDNEGAVQSRSSTPPRFGADLSSVSSRSSMIVSGAQPETSSSHKQTFSYYELAQTDYDCFEAIVNFAYTSRFEMSSKKIGELYKTAHALRISSIAIACAQYLIQNLSVTNCIGIRRQANLNDDELVEKVDSYIASNFPQIVNSSVEFTLLSCIELHLIFTSSSTKSSCSNEEIAEKALQYLQSLPRLRDRIDQWVEHLAGKTHMLYMEANASLHDCAEMDDHSSVGASDIIQDYKKTGGCLPRTYSGKAVTESHNASHHVMGATSVNFNAGRMINSRLSSTDSLNSELSSNVEPGDEQNKLISVYQTADDFFVSLVVLRGRLVVLSFQLSEAENVAKTTQLQTVSTNSAPYSEEQNQREMEMIVKHSSSINLRVQLPQMDNPRCSVGAAFIDGKIIVCGGYNRGECLKSVEEYDIVSSKWRVLPGMSCSRGRFDATVANGKVYAVAGSSGSVDLGTAECYDPKLEKWTPIKPLIRARSHNGCTALNGLVYCIGGCYEQEVLADAERYDPKTNVWTLLPPLQIARFQAGCTCWHGLVIVCGGRNHWKCLETVECFDPVSEKWKTLASLNTARRGCAVAVFKGSLYVIGGHDGTQSLSSVEILDHPKGDWRTGPPLTTPRANVRAVVADDTAIYLVGGFDGKQFLSSLEMLSSEELGWRNWQERQKEALIKS